MNIRAIVAVGALGLSLAASADSSTSQTTTTETHSMDQKTMDQGNINEMGRMPSSNSDAGSTPTGGTTTVNKDAAISALDLSPKDVCQKLVQLDSSSKDASSQMSKWLFGQTSSTSKTMHKNWLKNEIGSADCSSETVAGNHAVVVTKTGDSQRLIPFVKRDGLWKLDVQAYKSLYRMDSRLPASSK